MLLFLSTPVFAAEDAPKDTSLWGRETLTGDWADMRTKLDDHGVSLGATEIAEVLGNPTGGSSQGAIFAGRLEMDLSLDFEKLAGVKGLTAFANAYQIHGRGLSASDLNNNILTVSNIEALRTTRLFDLWLQQNLFDDMLSIRVGQLAADDEFIGSEYGGLYINSAFGWPSILATDLPGGGPAYPLSTPGVRVRVGNPDKVWIQAAVFNGNPAGAPGTAADQLRNSNGTNFNTDQGALYMAEVGTTVDADKNIFNQKGTYKMGAWLNNRNINDVRYDDTGLSQSDPSTSGNARVHPNDYGIYGVIDQAFWQQGDREAKGFVRGLLNPEGDRNMVYWYVNVGVNAKGLVHGRPDDVLGVGFVYAAISDQASALDKDTNRFNGTNAPVRDYESVIEVTYAAPITPWLTVQPDFQYLMHPGGNVDNPNIAGNQPIDDATIFGIRAVIKF